MVASRALIQFEIYIRKDLFVLDTVSMLDGMAQGPEEPKVQIARSRFRQHGNGEHE